MGIERYQIYRHYKGDYYQVVGIGKHTESEEALVIYQRYNIERCYRYGEMWVCPESMWLEEINGIPKFILNKKRWSSNETCEGCIKFKEGTTGFFCTSLGRHVARAADVCSQFVPTMKCRTTRALEAIAVGIGMDDERSFNNNDPNDPDDPLGLGEQLYSDVVIIADKAKDHDPFDDMQERAE
jgi:hypothetical protein